MWVFENGEWTFKSSIFCSAEGDDAGTDGGDADGGGGGNSGESDAADGGADGDKGKGGSGGDGLLANADADKAAGKDGQVTTDPNTGRPSNVPEQFWDAEKKAVNVDAWAKAWGETKAAHDKTANELKSLRDKNGTVPEKPEDYLSEDHVKAGEIPPPDGVKNLGPIKTDDEGLQAFLQSAHKNNLTGDQVANLIADMMQVADPMVQVFDEAAEMEKLGNNGPAMAGTVKVYVDGLKEKGIMPDDMYNATLRFGKTADGIKVLNFFRELNGDRSLPVFEPEPDGGLPSRDQWSRSMPDRNKDPDGFKKWQDQGKRLFGEGNKGIPTGLGVPHGRGGAQEDKTS